MIKKHDSNIKNMRLESELRSTIASVLNEIKDPRIPPFVSVVRTEVSSDRSHATVYISILGEYNEIEVKRGLKSAKGFIRKKIAESMELRIVPDLSFVLDNSIATGAKIEKIISGFTYHNDQKEEK